MRLSRAALPAASALLLGLAAAPVSAGPVSFTLLPGLTGGTLAATGVYVADLSALGGSIASVTITDSNSGIGGAGGQFSGFDLDAIVLSRVLITDASQVGSLTRAATFSFATSILTAGAQRAPTDPALFGTSGGQVNNAVATLDAFDGESTTAIPGAAGFVSLGDGGVLSINLTAPLAISAPLYLYIGEVGNNGEVAASTVNVSGNTVGVPEPMSLALFGMGLAGLGLLRRRVA